MKTIKANILKSIYRYFKNVNKNLLNYYNWTSLDIIETIEKPVYYFSNKPPYHVLGLPTYAYLFQDLSFQS